MPSPGARLAHVCRGWDGIVSAGPFPMVLGTAKIAATPVQIFHHGRRIGRRIRLRPGLQARGICCAPVRCDIFIGSGRGGMRGAHASPVPGRPAVIAETPFVCRHCGGTGFVLRKAWKIALCESLLRRDIRSDLRNFWGEEWRAKCFILGNLLRDHSQERRIFLTRGEHGSLGNC